MNVAGEIRRIEKDLSYIKLQLVKVRQGEAIHNNFIGLVDTPASYVGQAGEVPVVNAGETALEFKPVGILDDYLLEVDQAAGLAVNDFTKATANGLVGRSYAEVLADLSGEADATFDWNDQDLSKVNTLAGKEIATPANPAAGYNKIYCKADDSWYTLDSDGNEAALGGGAGGAHAILSATHSDTLAAGVVAGDVLYGNATPKWARLAKGDNDEVLTLKSGLPSWEPAAGGAPTEAGVKIFDSDFDSLAIGDVDGLGTYTYAGTWVNNSGVDCTAEIVVDPDGGQMLSLADASGANISEAYIELDIGAEVLTGIVEMKMKVSKQEAGSRGYFFFEDKAIASEHGGYFRGDADDLYYRTASGTTAKLVDAVVDTWYTVKWYFCRLANYSVWWVDDVFEQSRLVVNTGNKFDKIIFYTRDTYSGNTFDIKYVKVWNLNYV